MEHGATSLMAPAGGAVPDPVRPEAHEVAERQVEPLDADSAKDCTQSEDGVARYRRW